MSKVLAAIERHAATRPQDPALMDGSAALGYGALAAELSALARELGELRPGIVALAMENSPAWAVADLALLAAGVPAVPVPAFFTPIQQGHVLRDAGADLLITDDVGKSLLALIAAGLSVGEHEERTVAGKPLYIVRLGDVSRASLPAGTAKITYTSGTTGTPKGVCLGVAAQEQVAASLAVAAGLGPGSRHLSALPLATLLENVGGLYAPLLAGACAVMPPLESVGLRGAARFDAGMLMTALWAYDAASAILTPQMLQGLVAALETGLPAPARLRFLAVGGAPAAGRLLERAERAGLPAFEGYGLSECASVVAVNTPEAQRRGSVGKPLPHARVTFGSDGEILVSGATLLGYARSGEGVPAGPWPTGDLGHLDADGFLHITGRKKNIFITSYGRNVAPEWVERELTLHPAVAQAAVFGEGRPWNVAVVVPRGPLDPGAIASAIAEANSQLPDYARVEAWLRADGPFTPDNGQLTFNGRLRRDAILEAYGARIDQLYEEDELAVL
jgi:long-subunit acyl-CoA synthetase (AMP-forming)